jgi:hypothetical protein
MVSVGNFMIDNNNRLSTWETQIANITEKLEVSKNSPNLEMSFPKLKWAKSIEVRGIKSLNVPALKFINESLRFDDNNLMESFVAPNLTETGGDITFINNEVLNNITFPKLDKSGDLTIRNNQELKEINGFPVLTQVDGAVTLKGNFTDAELPKLDDVKGAFTVSSTEDIQSTCDTFQKLKSGGEIQGKYTCDPNNANANEGGEGSKDSKDDGAALLSINTSLMVAAAIAGLVQLL